MKMLLAFTAILLHSSVLFAATDFKKVEASAKWRFHQVSLGSDKSGYNLVLYKLADFKTNKDPHAFLTKTTIIPVTVKFHSEGVDRTLRRSIDNKKKDWIEGKFKNFANHRISELFDRYEGHVRNFGIALIGLGKTQSKSRQGIVLSQFDLESPLAGAGIMNFGVTNSSYEIILKPASDKVSVSLVLEENGVQSASQKTLSLKEIEGMTMESDE